MKKDRNEIKIICYIGATILLFGISFLFLTSIAYGDENSNDFVLPPWGGGMVHCDPQLTDNIRLPIPTNNVGILWHRHDGEAPANGIAGNGRIAACSFCNLSEKDNLIIYDYYGNHIWTSGQYRLLLPSEHPWSLNFWAFSSTPMVDINDQVVACDNKKIILVNASNHDNVNVEWWSNITSGGLPLIS